MFARFYRISLALLLAGATLWAQDAPTAPSEQPTAEKKADPAPADAKENKDAAPKADAPKTTDSDGGKIVGSGIKDEVKVLKPADVPNELSRVKSKADIKAEVTVLPSHGRPVVVKGVIRNGKLIERFMGRRFALQKSIDHPRCGVRLWWVEGSAGWIFLRYSQIQTIALTGRLTAKERRAIMKALKDRRDKVEPKTPVEPAANDVVEKMTPAELEAYLLRTYPAAKGWNHSKLRELKRKEIIEDKTLTREEAIFVKNFPILIKARLRELKARPKNKEEFEPDSDKKKPDASEKKDAGSPAGDLPPVGGGDDSKDDE